MNHKLVVALCGTAVCLFASAQGRDEFLKQQAYAEMQRVTGQIDVMQANFNELSRRVNRLEGSGEAKDLRSEINALKAAIADIRRELAAQRQEIVKDLSGRIAKIQTSAPSAPSKPAKPAYTGPCSEYTVQSGDSLYMIALAFKTNVQRLKEMNNLKSDSVRVGQKLLVPQVKE